MEARYLRTATVVACFLSLGASHRTKNFLVTTPSPELSRTVADEAESLRRELAIEWLGKVLPDWREPCPITVHVGRNMGAGGATSFMFERGRPFGWTMTIQGSRERILDSVLPHEITHTIFASHFGRPLPRWADEGACTTVEHRSEKDKQKRMLIEFLTSMPTRGIAFNQLFAMKEYPRDVMPLYAQGYSLARFLIEQGGKRQFVEYVGDGMEWNNWTKATNEHYGFRDLSDLQLTWLDWVRQGYLQVRPRTEAVAAAAVAASAESPATYPASSAPPVESTAMNDRPRDPAAVAGSDSWPRGGWYARTRDKAVAARGSADREAASADSTTRSPNALPAAQGGQLVTRPQPPVRPRQRVIEWQPPRTGNAGRVLPRVAIPPARAPGGYPITRYDRRGTVLR